MTDEYNTPATSTATAELFEVATSCNSAYKTLLALQEDFPRVDCQPLLTLFDAFMDKLQETYDDLPEEEKEQGTAQDLEQHLYDVVSHAIEEVTGRRRAFGMQIVLLPDTVH